MLASQRLNLLHYLYSTNAQGRFVGHCLDFDIVATADDFGEAEKRLDTLVKRHIERFLRSAGTCALDASAPEEFWTHWTRSVQQEGHVLPWRSLKIEVCAPVPMPNPYGELPVVEARAA